MEIEYEKIKQVKTQIAEEEERHLEKIKKLNKEKERLYEPCEKRAKEIIDYLSKITEENKFSRYFYIAKGTHVNLHFKQNGKKIYIMSMWDDPEESRAYVEGSILLGIEDFCADNFKERLDKIVAKKNQKIDAKIKKEDEERDRAEYERLKKRFETAVKKENI